MEISGQGSSWNSPPPLSAASSRRARQRRRDFWPATPSWRSTDRQSRSALDYLVSLVGRKVGERIAVKYSRAAKPGEAALTLTSFPTKPGLPSAGLKPGLRYRLYPGRFTRCPDFDKLKPARQGTATGPTLGSIPQLPDDEYALLLEGYLEIPDTGVWSFSIGSDDGSRLVLDGDLVAHNDGPHPMQFSSGRRRLQKGLHAIRIEFFEATGEAELQLTLSRDGSAATQEPKYFFDEKTIATD